MDNYQIGHRARIGVLIPSTNTGVEYDLQKFALDGVTWHPSRFWIELRNWADEDAKTGEGIDSVFERFLELMRRSCRGPSTACSAPRSTTSCSACRRRRSGAASPAMRSSKAASGTKSATSA